MILGQSSRFSVHCKLQGGGLSFTLNVSEWLQKVVIFIHVIPA